MTLPRPCSGLSEACVLAVQYGDESGRLTRPACLPFAVVPSRAASIRRIKVGAQVAYAGTHWSESEPLRSKPSYPRSSEAKSVEMNVQQTTPSYIFRLTEIYDSNPQRDAIGHWAPTCEPDHNAKFCDGTLWLCDGFQVQRLTSTDLPHASRHYSTFSMYYIDGKGFMVLRGDATHPPGDEDWRPLCFEHDQKDGCSSYLTNAKEQPALCCWRTDQLWVSMLLPDVYHGATVVQQRTHGALKGDLPIFLALIAFSIPREQLQRALPSMFQRGAWQQYSMGPHGRTHGRGVMVEVFTYSRAGGSTPEELEAFENGKTGKYYL